VETNLFDNRLLVFDRESAHEFGRIVAARTRIGQPMMTMDAMIAAIAIANRMVIATRDISSFDHLGIELINPFDPMSSR
jgi:predicted nucleic acid-binding protein